MAPTDFQNVFITVLPPSGSARRHHELSDFRWIEPPEGSSCAFERRTHDHSVGDYLNLADVARRNATADKDRRLADNSPRGLDQLMRARVGLAREHESVGGAESHRGVEVVIERARDQRI